MRFPLRRRRLFGALLVSIVLAGVGQIARAAPAEEAEAAVQRLVEGIIEILSSDQLDTQQGLDRLGQVIDQEANLDMLGRLSLGRHWRALDPGQQGEFRELFRGLMLRKFAGYLNAYAGQSLETADGLFQITRSREVSGGDILVESSITPESKPPLDVAWRVRPGDDQPLVIDVIVQEVSLLITQRAEFGTVIDQKGVDGFLADLRTRS